jgi:hypothetical protein
VRVESSVETRFDTFKDFVHIRAYNEKRTPVNVIDVGIVGFHSFRLLRQVRLLSQVLRVHRDPERTLTRLAKGSQSLPYRLEVGADASWWFAWSEGYEGERPWVTTANGRTVYSKEALKFRGWS